MSLFRLCPVRHILKPLLAAEIGQHSHYHKDNHSPNHEVPPLPLQFGHVGKIHAVQADDKRKGDKNRRNNRQNFHDLIHAVADAGEIDIQHPGYHISESLDGVDNLDGVVVDIPQVDQGGFVE